MKEPYNIETEEEFNRVMDAIDSAMLRENIPIPARQIKGWLKFSCDFGLGLRMSDPLSRRIMDWFSQRYGDKIKVDFAQGEIAVSIRGDLYKMYFPFFAGQIQVICDPRLWMSEQGIQVAKDETDPLPVVNVLNCIEGLTENYALTLSLDEQHELFRLFHFGVAAFEQITRIKGMSFIEEAKGDIRASISHVFDSPPQYGLSKWSSLQAVEKFVKAYITQKDATAPFSHDLQTLAKLAESQGLPFVSPTELARIQCSAAVRYGQIRVTKQEALEAHHAAIAVCANVARNL